MTTSYSSSNSSVISPRKLRSDLYLYEDEANMPSVISVLASLLERTISRNERISRKCTSKDVRIRAFESNETLDMTTQSFLERIYRYVRVAPPIYVVAYIYIDRLCQIHPEFRITTLNVHRLLITTIMVASKFVEDMNYRNSYYARVGGLATKEMNDREVDFLFLMGFKLHVNVSIFDSYCRHLEREVSIGGGYQIEKTIWSMCSKGMSSNESEKREFKQITHFIGCSSH
ncbi:Cyclin-U2-1 [Ranunculus cassubicifolius]